MDGLLPLSERAKELLTNKFGNSEFYIGLDPAILLGDSQVVTAGLIFIPLTLLIAVLVPGNRVLPFGDLATIGFFIAIAVAVHKGNLFRTLFSGSLIMFVTIWIANQTIPWMTALAKTTGSTDGSSMVAALDQGGCPITYMYTQLCTKENIVGLVVIAVVYIICTIFAIRCSKKRAAALKEENAVPFDDTVTFEQGAFFEPATVALHGLKRVPYEGGKTVAILGGGTIGMFVMQWSKIFGAAHTVVFDITPERLELGKRLGADGVINTLEEGFMEKAMALTDGKGFDYVFETAGNTITMKMAFELAANKAHVCFVGTPVKEISFSVKEWENMNRKEFTLTGSWMSYSAPFPGEEWKLVAHYFKTKELKFDKSFIFKKMPLSQIASAFEMYKTPGTVKGKILIDSEQ